MVEVLFYVFTKRKNVKKYFNHDSQETRTPLRVKTEYAIELIANSIADRVLGLLLTATAGHLLWHLLSLASFALGAALLTLVGGLASLAGGAEFGSLRGRDSNWFCNGCYEFVSLGQNGYAIAFYAVK